MSLIQLVGYHNLNKKHSLGASVRYFSIGKLNEWNEFGQTIGEGNPYELSADLSYSYRLIDQSLSELPCAIYTPIMHSVELLTVKLA